MLPGYRIYLYGIAILCWLILLVFGLSPGIAGEYRLIGGNSYDVCVAYERNLNSFKGISHAMVCDRLVNPALKDFRKPDWRKLDLRQYEEQLIAIEKFLMSRRRHTEGDLKIIHNVVTVRIKEDKVSLYEAFIDIDNDGDVDHIFRYDYGRCDPENPTDFSYPTGRSILIWDDDANRIDERLSKYLVEMRYDIFIYKSKTYHDYFGGDAKFKNGTLYVFEPTELTQELLGRICEFKYFKD